MADESWIEYGSKLTGEIAAKLFLNSVKPGLGSVVDFAQAARDYCDGNYAGAGVNAVSGVLEIGIPGMSSAWKGAAQESGKKALIRAAKEKAKTDGRKLVGEQVAKSLAEGGIEQTVNEAFSASTKFTFKNMGKFAGFSFISSGGQEVPKTMLEDTFRYFGEPAFEHILKGGVKQNAQSFSSEWMKIAAGRAARENFIQYSSRKFVWDLNTSVTKGVLSRRLQRKSSV